jgi:cytochrome c oxidase subunit 1
VKLQLWLWFVGMMILTLPWHWVGLLGMSRRMAYFDYSAKALEPQAWTVTVSTVGGALLVASAFIFVALLALAHRRHARPLPFRFSLPAHASTPPAALNGFALWVGMMIVLTLVNYGFPIYQLATLKGTSVPAVYMGNR